MFFLKCWSRFTCNIYVYFSVQCINIAWYDCTFCKHFIFMSLILHRCWKRQAICCLSWTPITTREITPWWWSYTTPSTRSSRITLIGTQNFIVIWDLGKQLSDLIREFIFLSLFIKIKGSGKFEIHLQTIWITTLYWKNNESWCVLYKFFKKRCIIIMMIM